jgi:hypothetical protein
MKITVNAKQFDQLMVELERIPDEVMTSSARFFERVTPKDKGNARNNTDLIKNKTEIFADYAYAERLDTGWSKQFGGKGMTNPTIAYIERQIDKKVGRLK